MHVLQSLDGAAHVSLLKGEAKRRYESVQLPFSDLLTEISSQGDC